MKDVAGRAGGWCGRADKGVKREMSCRVGLRMLTASAGSFLAHMQCSAKICDIMHRSAEGSTLYNYMNQGGRWVSSPNNCNGFSFFLPALPPVLLF